MVNDDNCIILLWKRMHELDDNTVCYERERAREKQTIIMIRMAMMMMMIKMKVPVEK